MENQYDTAQSATTNDRKNLTGRSHFFDLQFLHAMASKEREQPQDTLAKIMLWAEVMYRLSISEGIAGTDLLSGVLVTGRTTAPDGTVYTYRLSQYFDASTRPTGDAMLDGLLTRRTGFAGVDLGRRAIGSLLHLVQDSYAKGHVRRTLLNPADRQAGSTDQFKPGTWGRYGEIENFHCYKNQNDVLHSKYDTASGVDAGKADTFNPLIGARDALEASRKLLDMWHAGTAWAAAGGPKAYLEGTVFKLAATATPADTTV
jgi:hypothetical protein